ncbi:gliding motility-associated lipoprotein [Pedobacter changchengzhani]|uniref:Gliding motility-associated lipoprotein n=1 Tax=Pedobacter changchengzhani TaxID=2529274 RepID=A0A4R5MPQ9_9SPHI|nr:SUMF1/EgtB/PvdO family nonheme iron enzyme [Pedobacter changchengzhani]TDG37840.1 gliding motility-associated lipoprotein [Pedobacter changchengzhani]
MKKIYLIGISAATFLFSSCSHGGAGELVGAYNKKFKNDRIPLGMVYIPPGHTPMGGSDEDITFSQNGPSRMTTISAFYMDQTEISNAEYRQFTNWVRDSIAVTMMGMPAQFTKQPKNAASAGLGGSKFIDWKKVGVNGRNIWRASGKGGAQSAQANSLDAMYYSGLDALPGRKEIDVRKLEYSYSVLNMDKAAIGHKNANSKRQDYIDRYNIAVYPDTMVWKIDFSYSQNDPMVRGYFNHPSYDDYPVVGVSWEQCNAFSHWRTELYNGVAVARKLPMNSRSDYRLPSESEFEYASRGGNVKTKYPWGGPYIRNAKGCLQANFKPGRGDYSSDGGIYTVGVKSYFPNDYGLYNMSGNVAEWTKTAYNKSSGPLLHDLNPDFTYVADKNDSKYLKRKVVKGGSWKDTGFFLQNAVSTYDYQDEQRSYIGFRCVSSFMGTDLRR